jgi:hypothetical protein
LHQIGAFGAVLRNGITGAVDNIRVVSSPAGHAVSACSAVQTDTPTGIDQSLAVGLSDLINTNYD